jgi:RNA polymerase sigma factor (sigma-70 family)
MSTSSLTPGPEQAALRARLFPKMVSLCQRILDDRVLGKETAEDVWTDFVLFHAATVRSEAATEAYLRVIAVRRCRRVRMIQARHDPITELADSREGPESELIAADEDRRRQSRLAHCLSQLDHQAQRLLRMRYHLGMTQESIGQQLGVSKQYAGRILARTVAGLRSCVEAG